MILRYSPLLLILYQVDVSWVKLHCICRHLHHFSNWLPQWIAIPNFGLNWHSEWPLVSLVISVSDVKCHMSIRDDNLLVVSRDSRKMLLCRFTHNIYRQSPSKSLNRLSQVHISWWPVSDAFRVRVENQMTVDLKDAFSTGLITYGVLWKDEQH